ncbi:MAG: glutamate-5-semialdehyde dehydrogenase [Tepidisphaeraceae bacterium]
MDLATYATALATHARAAGLKLAAVPAEQRSAAIRALAKLLRERSSQVVEANKQDIAAAEASRLATPMVKRLMLDEKKVEAMARAVDDIASQSDPIGQVIDQHTRKDGLLIQKRRVPIGSVLFVYESRPNVTTDAAALCLRSGNAVILRGGKEAIHTNRVVAQIIADALKTTGLDPSSAQVVDQTDRALLPMLLEKDGLIDVVIPRGGHSLIRAVVDAATMPVLKHFDGNCHLYIDCAAPDVKKVVDVIVNAKTSYAGAAVCNAVEHLLFHRDSAKALLMPVITALKEKGVEVRCDAATKSLVGRDLSTTLVDAKDDDWTTEYLAFIVGIKVVESIEEAIDHVNRYGSHHTDGILSTDKAACEQFVTRVDSASVMVNASTRLADGGEYGLGAEIGISTDKLHARGPMGAADMCTYKWVVTGDGHLR